MIYLDNAATTFPKPSSVREAMCAFLEHDAANPGRGGHSMSVRAAQMVWQTRLALARLIGTTRPERIVFTTNCTDALNIALHGVLRPGDHVVTTSMDHNSVARPLAALKFEGVDTTRVACDREGFVEPSAVEAALRSDTRLVALTHASNVSGAIQPLGPIVAIARAHGVPVLVDAAQTLGSVPLNVEKDGIDLLAFPGHKGLYGPTGTGGLWVREGLDVRPLRQGGTGTRSESEAQPDELPDRLEAGTLNTVGIAGLRAAVESVLAEGVEQLGQHEQMLCQRLVDGLSGIAGVRVIGPRDRARAASAVSFVVDGWEPTDVSSVLDQSFGIACRAGLHCAPWAHRTLGTLPAGTVRMSPGRYTTVDEVDAAIEAVRAIAS